MESGALKWEVTLHHLESPVPPQVPGRGGQGLRGQGWEGAAVCQGGLAAAGSWLPTEHDSTSEHTVLPGHVIC